MVSSREMISRPSAQGIAATPTKAAMTSRACRNATSWGYACLDDDRQR
jgi:hypothetical protein